MKCIIIGSASLNNYSKLFNECASSDIVIAADGGIHHLEKINFAPDLFLGDMDSVFSEKNKKHRLSFFGTVNKSFDLILGLFKKVYTKNNHNLVTDFKRKSPEEKKSLNSREKNFCPLKIKTSSLFRTTNGKEANFERSKTCNTLEDLKGRSDLTSKKSDIKLELKRSFKKKFLKELIKKRTKIITLLKEKDLTDTFFAVKKAIKLGATKINIFGGLGQRPDHSFANFCIAKYLSKKNIKHKLIDDDFEVFIIQAGETKAIQGDIGSTVSVFPFGTERCKVSYTGLKYNLEKEYLELGSPIGISNEITAKECKVSVLEGCALVFLYYNF